MDFFLAVVGVHPRLKPLRNLILLFLQGHIIPGLGYDAMGLGTGHRPPADSSQSPRTRTGRAAQSLATKLEVHLSSCRRQQKQQSDREENDQGRCCMASPRKHDAPKLKVLPCRKYSRYLGNCQIM